MTTENIIEELNQTAKLYIGQKEIGNNQGFIDPEFQKLMVKHGWRPGYSWCMIFAGMVWKETYERLYPESHYRTFLNSLFTPGVLKTYKNFKNQVIYPLSAEPSPGLVFWKTGSITGHVGIVTSVKKNTIVTIEGNTNPMGSREGDQVSERVRKREYNQPNWSTIGYVKPISWDI